MVFAYYVQTHSNYGHLYLRLTPDQDLIMWEIQFPVHAVSDLTKGNTKEITIDELPKEIAKDINVNGLRGNVRDIWKLH